MEKLWVFLADEFMMYDMISFSGLSKYQLCCPPPLPDWEANLILVQFPLAPSPTKKSWKFPPKTKKNMDIHEWTMNVQKK